MKLAVIGGGSTYTPELVDGIARLTGDVKVTELVLVDPDEARLSVVGPFSARIMQAYGHPARLRWTTDLDDGLDGAGAVLLQLRVGGQAARHRDETWPLECGCVGQETTGAGGLAKALRTVPVVLDIAERARRRSLPDAWIIDFTNPVGIVTRALLDAGHRAIGLCNVAIGFQRAFAGLLGVRAGAGRARPRRAEPPDLGAGGPGRRRPTGCPGCIAAHGERDRRAHRAAAKCIMRDRRRGAVVLPALLLRARRRGRGAAGTRPTRAEAGRRDRAAAAGDVRRSGAGPQAGAADAPGRRVLLRGGGGPARLAGHRHRRHARS